MKYDVFIVHYHLFEKKKKKQSLNGFLPALQQAICRL